MLLKVQSCNLCFVISRSDIVSFHSNHSRHYNQDFTIYGSNSKRDNEVTFKILQFKTQQWSDTQDFTIQNEP